MADIKSIIQDILFDDDPENEKGDDLKEYDTKSHKAIKQKDEEKISSPIKASDILYRKPNASTFIDLDEEPAKKLVDEAIDSQTYEFSPQISPIFGVIKGADEHHETYKEKKELTNRPVDSHLDIITSPIYGYGNGYDLEEKANEKEKGTEEEKNVIDSLLSQEENALPEEENMDLFDDEINLFKLFGEDK